MKLEKFREKDNRKKITIGISIVLVLLIAGIIVYRSFAFYEEKKAFDVIKGQVPDQNYDLMFSYYIKDENGNHIYQENMPEGKDYTVTVECNNGATGVWNEESWGPIITNLTNTRTKCKLYFKKSNSLIQKANIGDYVYYKPSKTSYTTNASYVGGSSYVTTINPSELTLWRIIKKNEDGTIEIVSENTSSTEVTFYGQTGYKNIVGQLNLIAKQYEDSNYTVGSRHMGYSNQQEFITTITASNRNDTGYTTDTNLVQTALGSLIAKKVGTDTAVNYWIAGRYFYIGETSKANYYCSWYIGSAGGMGGVILASSFGGGESRSISNPVRPILVLKSGLMVKGKGTIDSPWIIN